MSKFYEAIAQLDHVIGSYAEERAIREIVLEPRVFEKIRFVVAREIELSTGVSARSSFGFEDLVGAKPYFKCRGIKFTKAKERE